MLRLSISKNFGFGPRGAAKPEQEKSSLPVHICCIRKGALHFYITLGQSMEALSRQVCEILIHSLGHRQPTLSLAGAVSFFPIMSGVLKNDRRPFFYKKLFRKIPLQNVMGHRQSNRSQALHIFNCNNQNNFWIFIGSKSG